MDLQPGENTSNRLKNIKIILVRPQMGENIGSVARVMYNFGMTQLRIVNPREEWPNPRAQALSVGARSIIDNATIHNSFEDAVMDCQILYASTARDRYMNKEVLYPEEAAKEIQSHIQYTIGVVMGPENSGLSNEEISLANKIISLPVNPEFTSLNLAQATGVICYEIFKTYSDNVINKQDTNLASSAEILHFFEHLESELEQRNFFQVENKKQGMKINLRNLFKRIGNLSSQDVRTLRGIITCLTTRNR